MLTNVGRADWSQRGLGRGFTKVFSVLTIAISLLAINGCATVFYGTTQRVSFETIPPGATLILKQVPFTEELRYDTPASIDVPRSISTLALFKKEGYQPKQVEINREMNILALCGNIITLGSTLYIDFVTGAAWTIKPDVVTIELQPEVAGAKPEQSSTLENYDKSMSPLSKPGIF